MGKRWFFLGGLALLLTPGIGAAQGYGYGDPPAYGPYTGYHENGLGWTMGWHDIYDSRPYSNGWYWPNVHWPSRDYHFTYRAGPDSYRVYYPSPTFPRGNSYVISFQVSVPYENADVWVEGVKMTQKGLERRFVSPPVAAGGSYTYEITARWIEDGREQKQTRQVSVKPGDGNRVSFAAR